jgi:hypothetical protein
MVIDEDNVVWIGNGLLQAMIAMGLTEAYCIVKEGMSENDKKKLMMSDNRIFDLGVDDMKAFDDLLRELGDDLDIPGYDEALIETLTADLQSADEILSEYGVVDPERKATITAAEETYERRDAEFAAQAEEYSSSDSPSASKVPDAAIIAQEPNGSTQSETPLPDVQLQRKYILCPKCGERIWL